MSEKIEDDEAAEFFIAECFKQIGMAHLDMDIINEMLVAQGKDPIDKFPEKEIQENVLEETVEKFDLEWDEDAEVWR